jgi:hypothetical protein
MPKVTRKPLHTRYTKYVIIDHILEKQKANNSITNLNPTTTKGNSQKSHDLNPGRLKGVGSIPIQGKKVGETEWVDYSSAIEAARILNIKKESKVGVQNMNNTEDLVVMDIIYMFTGQ